MHTTQTALTIDTAARSAHGDHAATVRALARFCTESLVDAAESALDGMTLAEREKFAWEGARPYARRSRDWAVNMLCSWVHVARMREFAQEMDRIIAARRAHLVYSRCERVS